MPAARTVLVFGATSGIGLATALRFAGHHDRLVLVARSGQSLATAADACRRAGAGAVDTVVADLAESADVEAAVRHALDIAGTVDVAVVAAATMAYGRVEDVPREIFESVVRTAVFGTAHVAREVLPIFRRQRGGTLIVVNSLLGSVTVPDMGAYATAKWGQRGLVRTLQQETRGDRGVHVCLVSPGGVNTPIYDQAANYLGRAARPPWPVRSPEHVAARVARLAEHPRRDVSLSVGAANPLIIFGFRLLPFVYDRIVAPLFRLVAVTRRRVAATAGNVVSPTPGGERLHGRWPPDAGES